MSWLRYSDDFTEWREWDHASIETRWAYVCLVQACSRGKYWDGVLPKSKALGALFPQVADPHSTISSLVGLGLATEDHERLVVVLPRIDDHIPPPYVRDNAERSKVRMRRKRAHDSGDHSLCLAEGSCPEGAVTESVTRNPGTGRGSSSSHLAYVRDERDEAAS